MRLSYQALLLGGIGLASAFDPPKDECTHDAFLASKESGATWDLKEGNTYFCDTRWKEGLSICGIRAWTYKYHHAGIQFKYSNGEWGPLHGRRLEKGDKDNYTPDQNELTWDCTQPVTGYHSFPNWEGFSDISGKPDAVGGIRITAGGKEFKATSDVGSYQGEFQEVGSGYLAAVRGRSGSYLDTLELKFFKGTVKSAEMIDIKFKKDLEAVNKEKKGIEKASLAETWYINPDESGNRTFNFMNTEIKETSKTIDRGHEDKFGIKVGAKTNIKSGIPFLAEAKIEISTEVSYEHVEKYSESLMEKSSVTLMYGTAGTLRPKTAMYCKAWAYTGRYEDDYDSTMRVHLSDGSTIDTTEEGHYVSVGWTKSISVCDEKTLDEAPKDSIMGEPLRTGDIPPPISGNATSDGNATSGGSRPSPSGNATRRSVTFRA